MNWNRCWKPLAVAVGVLIAPLAAGAHSTAATDAGPNGTLRIGMGSEAESLDPPNFVISADFTRMDLIFDTLVDIETDGTIVAGLATEWNALDDVTWEFTLREGVEFHDGTSLDAAAVKFVLDRSREQPQGAAFLGVIEDVEEVDAMTVRVTLSQPFAAILNNLATPVSGIYSPASVDQYGDAVGQHPVGTGPYRFVEWQIDTRLTLEANTDYWGDAPTLERIEFYPVPESGTRMSALRAGELDVIENPPPEEAIALEGSSSDLLLVNEPKARPIFLGFNVEAVPDPLVRQAIAHAIDKELIVEAVLEGLGTPATEGLIPSFLQAGDGPYGFPYDPDRARELVAEAGAEGITLRVVVPTERYLRDTAVVEVIQAQLADIGINLELDIREPGAWYQALLDRDTELYWLGWGLNALDPGDLYTRLFTTDAVNNMSQLSEPAVDDLIAELAGAPIGSDERDSVLAQLERAVLEEQTAVVAIYHAANLYATSGAVSGFHTTPNELLDLSEVSIG